MTIRVTCDGCDRSLKAPDSSAGRKIKCPQCGGAIAVPDSQEDEEAPRRPKKKRKAKKSGAGLYIGLGVGALVVVIGVIVLIVVLANQSNPQQKQVAQEDKKAGKEDKKAGQEDKKAGKDQQNPIHKLPIELKKADGPASKGTLLERTQSQQKLKQLAMAMQTYAGDNGGKLPKANNKGLSWRVALLPYLEQEALYNQFKHNEPWDSPHNKKLIDKMPAVYVPVYGEPGEGKTYYQVFTGKLGPFNPQPRLPASFTDGTSNTLLIVEGYDAVVWTQPSDIEYNEMPPPKLGGMFTLGFNAAMADGSVRFFFHSDMNPTLLHGAITPAGGEPIQLPEP